MHPLRRVHTTAGKESVKRLIPVKTMAKNHRIALQEGNAVFDFCNSTGFAIVSRDIKKKLDESTSSLIAETDRDKAEVFRIRAQTWKEVITMFARYLQDRESAEKALIRKKKVLSPQGEVSSEQD